MWSQVIFLLQLAATFTTSTPTYDYIIIGGGTAGLTVAARLTENPNISVLVLEAGNDHSNDTKIISPALYTSVYGDPEYDWNYKTVPQIHAAGQVVAHPRGKQLGGSSAINFLFWTHASKQDIDNWGELGNSDWSWTALDPFYRKSESFVQPSAQVALDVEAQFSPSVHGANGPILNTYPDIYGPLDEAWPRTYDRLGLGVKSDPRAGLALGGYTNLLNMDLNGRKRIYAANGYFVPASKRPNMEVITGALAEKILFESCENNVKAMGVRFSRNNKTMTATAAREVILSAGTIGSPQMLELSGIGDHDLLKKHGIDTVIGNANVGENLQDHAYIPLGFEVIPGVPTLDDLADPAYFEAAYEQYIVNATGPLATTSASSGLLSCEQIKCGLQPPSNFSHASAGIKAQYKLISRYFYTEAITQQLAVSGGMSPQFVNDSSKLFYSSSPGNFFSLLGVLEHPYSRGSVHIKASDPKVYPLIDPQYFSHPFDLEVMKKIALSLQRIASTPPLGDLLKANGTVYQPGYHKLTEQNVEDWVKNNFQTEDHPIGTCAMMPKNLGGVVDERLKVYGASNLRIIDASIFPLQVRGNLQTLVYAVAERGAEFIKQELSAA